MDFLRRVGDVKLTRLFYLVFVIGLPLATAFFCQTFVTGRLQVVLPVIALVIAFCCCVKDRDRLQISFGQAVLLLFFLWAAADQNTAFAGKVTSYVCQIWLLVFGCILFVSLIIGNAQNREREWSGFFWGAVLAIGIFYAAVTIICWVTPAVHDAIYTRFFASSASSIDAADWKAGFTNHYSTNGMYLAFGLIACVPLLLDKRKNLIFRLAPFIVILLALLLTTKRAHLVFGVGSIAVAMILFGSREKLSIAFKAVIAIAIAVLCVYVASLYAPDLLDTFNRIADMSSNDDTSTTDRLYFSTLCQQIWEKSPVVGSGMGTYAVEFNTTGLSANYIAAGYSIMYAHNCFWQVLAEQGIIGFALLILAFAANLLGSVRLLLQLNRNVSADWRTRAFLAASVSMQIFFILYCTTGNPLYDMQAYIPYLFSCGVYFAVSRQASAEGLLFHRGHRRSLGRRQDWQSSSALMEVSAAQMGLAAQRIMGER